MLFIPTPQKKIFPEDGHCFSIPKPQCGLELTGETKDSRKHPDQSTYSRHLGLGVLETLAELASKIIYITKLAML